MNAAQHSVRRANLDDLVALKGLWQFENLPAYELEKRLTEFQVVTRGDGVVTGAIGLLVAGAHALVHSPAFLSAAQEAEGLPLLWERVQVLARKQGVVRLWMRGQPEGYWRTAGFRLATPAELRKLPPGFGLPAGNWSTFALRDETAIADAVEKEFEALHAAHEEQTDRVRRQARFWKLLAILVATAFFGGAIWLLFVLLRTAPRRDR